MASRLWVPVASGPLAPYAVGYGAWLAARGYSRWAVAHRLWQLDLLSRWTDREGLLPSELTRERVETFVAVRRAAGYSTWLSLRSTVLPLGYLRELGVVPSETTSVVVDDPVERVLAGYPAATDHATPCWRSSTASDYALQPSPKIRLSRETQAHST